jgi:excinuclease ABC subunit B
MYADTVTESMKTAINETARRRAIQAAYNLEHGITPTTIVKNIDGVLQSVYERDYGGGGDRELHGFKTAAELDAHVVGLERRMREAAANLDFEAAAALRDQIAAAKGRDLGLAPPGSAGSR